MHTSSNPSDSELCTTTSFRSAHDSRDLVMGCQIKLLMMIKILYAYVNYTMWSNSRSRFHIDFYDNDPTSYLNFTIIILSIYVNYLFPSTFYSNVTTKYNLFHFKQTMKKVQASGRIKVHELVQIIYLINRYVVPSLEVINYFGFHGKYFI